MKKVFIIFLVIFSISTLISQSNRKALIIGIDGVRGDAALAANTPTIDALAANGKISYEAQTIANTVSGPGWTTMLTGVWMDKHGVKDNTFIPNNMVSYPHFFQHVEGIDSDLQTASIVHWSPINILVTPLLTTDVIGTYDTDLGVEQACVDLLANDDPDIVFLHFDDVDHAGHSYGFSADNPEYLTAIEVIDDHLAAIMTALENRPNYEEEEWLIVLCTDHGGQGTGHDCNQRDCQDIFQVISSNLIEPEVIEKDIVNLEIGSSLAFNGNDSYISIPDATQHNFNGKDFTIEVKLKTTGWSEDAPIISNKDWESGLNSGFILSGNTDGSKWKFNIGDGAFLRMDMEGGAINDDEWHHIAVSFDRDGQSFTWQDGYIQEINFNGFLFDTDSDFPLVIGQDGTMDYLTGFNGMISEVRIWDTNLRNITLNNWNCKAIDNEHPNYGNLVGFWKLDEGTGVMVNDLSSYQENGTIDNATWENTTYNYDCFDYSNVPHNVDIVSTVMDFMCLDMDPSWGLDGKSYAPTVNCNTTTVTTLVLDNIHVYPNKSSDKVFYEVGQISNKLNLNIYSSTGLLVMEDYIDNEKGNIDVSEYIPGVYFMIFEDKETGLSSHHKIIVQ